MSSSSLVTIITPAYNRADYLPEVVESVLSQGYEPLEYIVLDDGSTDNTLEVMQCYKNQVIFESHANMGETRTVNKAFSMATGEIICVVNSDDPLLPGAIPAAVQAFCEHPEALVVYSDWLEIGPDSGTIREYKLPHYDIRSMLREFNVAMGPGTFFRCRAFELVGFRDVNLRYTGDLDYWFRLSLHGPFVHIPRPLATHRTHSGAASNAGKGAKMAAELIRIVHKVYADPRLPEDLRRARRKVLAHAHWVARHYCGSDRVARLRHTVISLRVGGWRVIARNVALRVQGRVIWARAQMQRLAAAPWDLLLTGLRLGCLLAWRARDLLVRRSKAAQPRRFLVVSHVLPPSWSGQAVILGRLLSGVDPRHYCLASIRNYDPSCCADEQGVRLPVRYHCLGRDTQLPGHSRHAWIGRLNAYFGVWHRAARIASILYRERCSAVIADTGDLIDPPATALAARLTGAAFYLHLFDDYVHQWIDPATQRQARRFERRMMRRAAGVIAPNEFLGEEIRRRYGREVCLVRNVCARRVNASPPQPGPEHNHSSSSEATLLYTGAVYHVNTETLRTVIAALGRIEAPRVRLHIYTAQPAQALESHGVCGPYVAHHPHAPGEQVEQVHRQADLLLIPFDFRSSVAGIIRTAAPGKLGDYLSSGTPILAIVPPDSFVAWYLRRHDCGLVVDQDDPEAVAEAIRRLLQDAALRARITTAAVKRAAGDFDPAPAQRQLLGLLEIGT